MGRIPTRQAQLWDTSPLHRARVMWDDSHMATLRKLPEDATFTARELVRRMESGGFTQKSLATAAEVNETYVRDILRGKSKNPKSQQLKKVADALGCEVADLTDPGRSGSDKPLGKAPNRSSEVALIEMWRVLSPHGQTLAIKKVAQLLPRHEVDVPPAPARKSKNV